MAYFIYNGNIVRWEDYLSDKVELGKQLKKVSDEYIKECENNAVDNTKVKKEYTKHVLIERTLTVNGYEFNFIDIETKEFYWSYYSDELDYNMAKESFLNKISGKVKFYLEE